MLLPTMPVDIAAKREVESLVSEEKYLFMK